MGNSTKMALNWDLELLYITLNLQRGFLGINVRDHLYLLGVWDSLYSCYKEPFSSCGNVG